MDKEKKMDIGVMGLSVMGENLVMNIESRGFKVAAYNRRESVVTKFIEGRAKGLNIKGVYSPEELVESLTVPRKVMLMIKAGQPVDDVIEKLIPLLSEGDVIIDGGNSYFQDSIRRTQRCEKDGIYFIGTGVSGGEEGALKGPSIMPGGSPQAWPLVKPIFQAIAAKVEDGTPCCEWVGQGGAGHFVKMVHNGIEYGDMQLICEAYQIMRTYAGMTAEEIGKVFDEWNKGVLDSYLIEITGEILAYKDEDGFALVDNILDTAGQKGTGKWTSVTALDEGIPLTLISEAVFARCLSALKDERVNASRILKGPSGKAVFTTLQERKEFIEDIHDALYASKIISYAQGFSLMKAASQTYGWDLDYGSIALLWRGGCIIRSQFLSNIKEAYDKEPKLGNLMLDEYFTKELDKSQDGWRKTIALAVSAGIPVPAFASALTYYDGYRSEMLPANLLQAQRDYFGAHTYERTDRPRGEFSHTNWTGRGGDTASSTYNA
ncbi:decarboxylating NADP(+)-dependent phosphogluconate dehydrogenase [Candidatus Nomurabacteria bacterium]|nr:decarboxylating NADP(+)-dependent phosphogluconate dehydrogenase [Candidatus Nomurabacteria bacterium]